MPKWDDYKQHAKERGSLAFELYAVQSFPSGSPEAVKDALPDHLAYQGMLEEKGILFLAGPISDETGEEMIGAGLIIYRTTSLEHAKEIAANDPMHQVNARSFTVRRWLINEGGFSLSLGLSKQTVTFEA